MDDESYAVIEEILRDDEETRKLNFSPSAFKTDDDHDWHTVRRRRTNLPNSGDGDGDGFRPIEEDSSDRRREFEILAAEIELVAENSAVDGGEGEGSGGGDEVAAKKAKKAKRPKMTVADAATRIDASDLASFLADITEAYEKKEDILLMRFVEYFGRVFGSVPASQFPWVKTLKDSTVEKMIDIPISQISGDVYKISTEWLKERSSEGLGTFVVWLWDSILADLEIHQGSAKGPKKVLPQVRSKSQVAIFVVLAMTLQGKPEVLANLMPTLRDTSKYQGQDKLPVTVWVIAQACQGDLAVGLFMWVSLLLPMLNTKPSCNPQSRDLILQVVERILASPKAGRILLNGVVRKGERLVPPTAFELLVRSTFPASSARVKATERFEAVYPMLKEVALAGPPGSKVMKQLTQFAIKAAGEGVSELSKEATNLAIWCLTHHHDSYRQWDEIYLDNLEASVRVLRKLANEWKDYSTKVISVEPLKATLTSFRKKNARGMKVEEDGARLAIFKEAEKLRKMLMAHVSKSHTCFKGTVFVSAALAVCATAAVVMSLDTDSWDLKKLAAGFV